MRSAFWLLQITTLLSICAFQLNAHSLSGNAGIASAAMNLTGGENLTVMANYYGNYSFRRLPPGNYTVTPSLSGYAFSPASQSVTIDNASVNSVSFTATAINTTITDLVASPASLMLTAAGATQQLMVQASYSSGASTNVTSTAAYASNSTSVATVSQGGLVTAVGTGNATVIASYGGLSSSVSIAVSAPSATYILSGSTGAASATVVAISGTAGPAGTGGAAETSTTASGSGTFSFSNLPPGSYIITPSLAGYTFTPSSQSATITNANVSGVNFAPTATAHSVDLSWGAGTIQDPVSGQVVVGYNVYRSSVSGGPYTQLNSSPNPGLSFIDNTVSSGQTLYYVCSTVDSLGNVSDYSNQATATVP
jgi:Bacterial Ig-like domain (group 2)